MQQKKRVVVSGGFDPLHVGHVRLIKQARELGDYLTVILNNDNWLLNKKGYVFMKEKEREEILRALSCVDDVVMSSHERGEGDQSVSKELEQLKPDIFANGGDRRDTQDIPEADTCEKYGIEMIFNVGEGGKLQSSSWLVKTVQNNNPKNEKGQKEQ